MTPNVKEKIGNVKVNMSLASKRKMCEHMNLQ